MVKPYPVHNVLAVLILLMHVNNSLQYFCYDDCGSVCTAANKPCIITEANETSFNIECVNIESCLIRANEAVPCISENAPTKGGQALWPIYKDGHVDPQPSPQPSPQGKTGRSAWFTVSMIQTVILLNIMITLSVKKFRKYRARLEFDRLPIFNPENPYEPCVENIPPED